MSRIGKKPIEISDFKNGAKIHYSVMEDRYLDAERIMRYTNAAIKHDIGNLWFKVSDEGRFYNSVINLSSTVIASPKEAITEHDGFLLLNTGFIYWIPTIIFQIISFRC